MKAPHDDRFSFLLNAFTAMNPTSGTHHILTRNWIEKHFLFSFLRKDFTHNMLSALPRHYLIYLLHNVMFFVKTRHAPNPNFLVLMVLVLEWFWFWGFGFDMVLLVLVLFLKKFWFCPITKWYWFCLHTEILLKSR